MCTYFKEPRKSKPAVSLSHCRNGPNRSGGEDQYAPARRPEPLQGTGRPDEPWTHNLFIHPAPHGEQHRCSRRSTTIATHRHHSRTNPQHPSRRLPKLFRTILLFVPQRLQQGQLGQLIMSEDHGGAAPSRPRRRRYRLTIK